MPKRQIDLNPQQRAAINHEGSILVSAGPGTGKTRVITSRIEKLINDGIPANSIMAVTFTSKAGREMRKRLNNPDNKTFIGTFHAFGLRVLLRFRRQAGLPGNLQVIDEKKQSAIIGLILEYMNVQEVFRPSTILEKIVSFKEKGLRAKDVTEKDGDKDERLAYWLYEMWTKLNGYVDFAEMILRCCELLEHDSIVRKKVTDRYRHVLIDELQDINPLQMRLLRAISTQKTVFFGVGDDDQSIYGFRGANPKWMKHFAVDFADNKVLLLEHNYRSTDSILNLANWIIEKNEGRMGKTLMGNSGVGNLPELVCHDSDEIEAAKIANKIAGLIEKGVNPKNIAVLYRNNYLSKLLEAKLVSLKVPFKVHGEIKFFSRTEVRNALAYMQVAVDPTDIDSVIRSITSPWRGVEKNALESARSKFSDDGKKFWDYLCESGHNGVRDYVNIIKAIRHASEKGDIKKAATIAIKHSGLQGALEKKGELKRALNLDWVVNIAGSLKDDLPRPTLNDFLLWIFTEDDIDQVQDRVVLSTIHSGKGLEFDHLFVLGVENGILPDHRATLLEEIEEERRLLYVAITRARQNLTISFARERRGAKECSPFLHGVDGTGLLVTNGFFEEELDIDDILEPGLDSNWDSELTFVHQQEDSQVLSSSNKLEPQPCNPTSMSGYHLGQKVESKHFGLGEIIAFRGQGETAKARVLFFDDGQKIWLELGVAELRPSNK